MNSIGTYDATTQIPAFKGLLQYGDGINGDPSFAVEEKNLETRAGVLQPAAACELLSPTLDYPIETLMRLHRRWHSGDDKDILVAASHGQLYSMLPGGNAWTQLELPSGVDAFEVSKWSWVTYEINPEGSDASVDVLLMSNAVDGMVMVRGDNMSVSLVPTPKKYGVIERYAERIWGGAITDDPDMLSYSAPLDPTDWDQRIPGYVPDPENPLPWTREGQPEDGAGEINQPSWDGDSFTALRSFGAQVIAFKRTRVWRILGTDPGEYTFKEQYGGGCPYEKTIAVDGERILMLTDQGVVAYDGLAVTAFQQQYAENIWKRMNKSHMDEASAIFWKDKYYVSIPLDNSAINNAVVIYDPLDNTWLVREDVNVESFLGTEKELYFTSSTTPGKVWLWKENSWETGECTSAATRWVSPWNDLGLKSVVKGGFEVYLLVEVQDEPVTLNISIQTEKKIKTKKYTIKPLTETELSNNKSTKQKKLHFGGAGRRFRIIIESPENSPVWRMVSGVMILSEIDPD
jgi:hypothetical protein